jgi:hypothetical protein
MPQREGESWEESEKREDAELKAQEEAARKARAAGAKVLIVSLVVLFLLSWVGGSYMEARTYSRLTGKDVSTWDAMWVDLRIQEGAK